MSLVLLLACARHGKDESDVVFEEGAIHDVDITLDDEAWSTLESSADAIAHATLAVDGDTFDVGIHRKGSSTLRGMQQKASFLVDFAEYVDDQRWHGLRHIALNNMVIDPTMAREHVAAWMYAKLGIVAARHSYARVRVNGEPWGLYGLVESLDQPFLDRRWPTDPDGWLYDSLWNVSDVTPEAMETFTVQEEGEGEAFVDLRALVDAVDATNEGAGMGLLQDRFDAEEFLLGQAAEIVFGNYDAYWFNRSNYLLYHAPAADRWHMIPWGPDQAFMGNGSVHDPPKGELDVLCAGDPACVDALDEQCGVVAEAMMDEDLLGYVEDTVALIADECEADPRRERECDPSSLVEFVRQRPEYVLSQLTR